MDRVMRDKLKSRIEFPGFVEFLTPFKGRAEAICIAPHLSNFLIDFITEYGILILFLK